MRIACVPGGGANIFVSVASEDVSTDNLGLGGAVLAGLGGGVVDDLAGTVLFVLRMTSIIKNSNVLLAIESSLNLQ